MDVLHASCAGLDVHKKTVVATVIISHEKGKSLHDIAQGFTQPNASDVSE